MRFLVITLILVAAVAHAKNFQKRDDYFDIDNTKDTKNTDLTDSQNFDQSIPDFNIQPKKSSDEFSNDGDYLEESDEDYSKPVRLAAPAVRKAKKPLQVDALRKATLAYINLARRLHAASPLLSHGPLTVGAQKWANNLVKAGKVAYDKATTHNQTIGVEQKEQFDAVRDVVVSWYARAMNYDWAHKKVNKDNKDFVILINRRATHCGIGISRGPLGKVYVVVFYSPRVDEKTLVEDILPQTAKCQKGYKDYQGTCYKIHTQKKNWMGAIVECAKENAVLSDVPSAAVEGFLKKEAKKITLWDGLNDRITEGMYSYVDGSPVSHLNWKTGEPQGKNQNCVAIDFKSSFGTMADKKCTELLQFICKKPLEGYVLMQVVMEMPNLNFQKEFSDQASILRQKLNSQITAAYKVMMKGETTFVKAFVIKVEDGSKPKAVPKKKVADAAAAAAPAPAPSYYNPYAYSTGKKRDEISPTATAMPSSGSPTVSSSDSFDDNFLDSFDDKSKAKKPAAKKTPPKKSIVTVVLKFGKQNIKPDPTLPLQEYLAKNKGRSAAPLGQATKILSVKLLPPGTLFSNTVQSVRSSSCSSSSSTKAQETNSYLLDPKTKACFPCTKMATTSYNSKTKSNTYSSTLRSNTSEPLRYSSISIWSCTIIPACILYLWTTTYGPSNGSTMYANSNESLPISSSYAIWCC
ncbi:hypothetical protein QZH41_004253 [Actinostola sp. cb2023]|nr:hypothetical protein QZH41_004253 [Actinostola sp. cb2023]